MTQETKAKAKAEPFALAVEAANANDAPTTARTGESGERMAAFEGLIRTLEVGKAVKLAPKGDQTVRGLALSLSHAARRLSLRKEDVQPGERYIDVVTGADKDGVNKAWARAIAKPTEKASS